MNQRAVAMGQEFRGKGVNIQLGPFMYVALRIVHIYIFTEFMAGTS